MASRNPTVTGQVTDGLAESQHSWPGSTPAPSAVVFDAYGRFSFPTTLPLGGSADGTHIVHIQATDRAGNVSSPSDLAFVLDTTPPDVALNGTPLDPTNRNVTIDGHVTDALSGVATLQVLIDSVRRPRRLRCGRVLPPHHGTSPRRHGRRDPQHPVPGDRPRGECLGTGQGPFTLDSRPPTIVIESPSPGALTATSPTIQGRASDLGSGVASVQARLDSGARFR